MFIAHSDWGSDPAKQWVAVARLDSAGRWTAFAPRPVGPAGSLRRRMGIDGESLAVLGFDFPIGIPRAYAAKAGVDDFPTFLSECGSGVWKEFFSVADRPEDINVYRPFYPATYLPKGAKKRHHLTDALGIGYDDLLRRCDVASAGRGAACAIFWTCGGNQVGKGAISGWQLLQHEPALRLWPFHGPLEYLLSGSKGTVVAETYPTEFARQLGLGRVVGKQKQEVRKLHGDGLLSIARQLELTLDPTLEAGIRDGFGSGRSGDDKFDAVIGLLGMLNVISGRRNAGVPHDDEAVCRVEGWMLGQDAS